MNKTSLTEQLSAKLERRSYCYAIVIRVDKNDLRHIDLVCDGLTIGKQRDICRAGHQLKLTSEPEANWLNAAATLAQLLSDEFGRKVTVANLPAEGHILKVRFKAAAAVGEIVPALDRYFREKLGLSVSPCYYVDPTDMAGGGRDA